MRRNKSPYRSNEGHQFNSIRRNNQYQDLGTFRKYGISQYTRLQTKKHKYQNNNPVATEYKLRFQEQKKVVHQSYTNKNPPIPYSRYVGNMHNAEQRLDSKQKRRSNLNNLHHMLNEVTQRYASGQSKIRGNTPKISKEGLRGQEDYEMMKRRRQQIGTFRDSLISSTSKQKTITLQPNKSTADIFHSSRQRTNSKSYLGNHSQREPNGNGTSILDKFYQLSASKNRQKSNEKSVKKSKAFLHQQQFSVSTNFTFEGKAVELSDFILLSEIESGRTGRVYRCIHKVTLTIYALKIITKKLIKNLDEQRFMDEIKIQMYVKHPNIVSLYGFFNDQQNVYLIMQYCEGGNLFDFVKGPQLPSQKVVAMWMRDILKALTYLHDLKIVHRDIKPQNIILSSGVAKLCDFGCAALCSSRRNTNIGTFDYLAPQILKHQEYDQNVDVWGLGILTYQLLTGKAPFYHSSKQITVQKILKDQLSFPETMSKQAQSFINMLLIREPKQRCSARVMQHHSYISINCNQFTQSG